MFRVAVRLDWTERTKKLSYLIWATSPERLVVVAGGGVISILSGLGGGGAGVCPWSLGGRGGASWVRGRRLCWWGMAVLLKTYVSAKGFGVGVQLGVRTGKQESGIGFWGCLDGPEMCLGVACRRVAAKVLLDSASSALSATSSRSSSTQS